MENKERSPAELKFAQDIGLILMDAMDHIMKKIEEQDKKEESKKEVTEESKFVLMVREELGYTQVELARKLKISQGELSKIESGIRTFSFETRNKLVRLREKVTGVYGTTTQSYGIITKPKAHRKHFGEE